MMQVNPIAASAAKAEKETSPSAQLGGEAFLTLLVAQLRSQNPFDPMDPMEFVNQLVQFNMLDQTIRIRLALESQEAAGRQAS
jgi:flagellar basal-body rod modification protein FlgD